MLAQGQEITKWQDLLEFSLEALCQLLIPFTIFPLLLQYKQKSASTAHTAQSFEQGHQENR